MSSPNELNAVLEKSCPRYIFFAHWNWLVPKSIWYEHECVCFHMTDVPCDSSPLQNLIMSGHTHTKLTALRMVEDIDAGLVYAKRDLELSGTAQEIYVKAGALSMEIMEWMVTQHPIPDPQEGEVVTFKRRKPEQSLLPEIGHQITVYGSSACSMPMDILTPSLSMATIALNSAKPARMVARSLPKSELSPNYTRNNTMVIEINGRQIGQGYPPYITAELSANHNGNIERAFQTIGAHDSGAHAIEEIQTYTADTIDDKLQ